MAKISAGILIIGDEILDGFIQDTNSVEIIRSLARIGIRTDDITKVRDAIIPIRTGVRNLLKRNNIVITSGGLGPTPDDVTSKAISGLFKSKKARLFKNPIGSTPGMMFEDKNKLIFLIPGVPDELKAIVKLVVIYLKKRTKPTKLPKFCLRTIGISERNLMRLLRSFAVRYYPMIYGVDLYFENHRDRKEAKKLIAPFIYSTKDPLEILIGRMLKKRKSTLAVAESCTGGMLGSLITDVPGSSRYYLGGVIGYDNRIKEKVLGVGAKTLINRGAVSLEVAREMAKGVRRLLGSDLGIGITGIAGPSGGAKKKPVGLVYIGLSSNGLDYVGRFQFKGNRPRIRIKAAYYALNLLRQYLTGGLL